MDGERAATAGRESETLVTGFSYRPETLTEGTGNFGLRVAEGVEGTLRVLWADKVQSLVFEPGYWLLEPGKEGYRVVPIRDQELMVLIVFLSEIGNGNPVLYERAVEHLWQWVSPRWGRDNPEYAMLMLLRYVRDWGPLGMGPLYGGLVEILDRLKVEDAERVLFEFYADHWGVRDNRNGRLLAVRTLEALDTDASRATLREILSYVRNRGLSPEELALTEVAAGITEREAAKAEPETDATPSLLLHPVAAR